jgi:hypothetical protein
VGTRRVHQGSARRVQRGRHQPQWSDQHDWLGNYVKTRVESLTDSAQTPGMEIRYDTTVFAAGM